uniref:Putative secreted peptide n=1 Tax=Anopheles braziliensis TaxID=58242 RepID=A0A2M3ZRW1_9DIPT
MAGLAGCCCCCCCCCVCGCSWCFSLACRWARHSRKPTRNSSALSRVNTIGGFSLTTLSSGPSLLTSIRWTVFMRSTTALAALVAGIRRCRSLTSSMPTNRPVPRTSPTSSYSAASVRHWSSR